MRVRGMVPWCRDSLGYGFRSQNDRARGLAFTYSNITGEGFRTLKGVTALVTIKQLARQA